jgi:predicted negative regulator of RcsB-dependent stress response
MLIAGTIVAVVVGYLGRQLWTMYQDKQSETVGNAYAAVTKAFEAHDAVKTRAAADAMTAAEPSHAATARAMLLAARAAVDAKDTDHAKSALQWVIDHAKEDAVVDTAKLRLAAVLTDQKQFDAALGVLATAKTAGFSGLFADARGDILLVKGDNDGAKKAYQEAIAKVDKANPAHQIIETKLLALGA